MNIYLQWCMDENLKKSFTDLMKKNPPQYINVLKNLWAVFISVQDNVHTQKKIIHQICNNNKSSFMWAIV